MPTDARLAENRRRANACWFRHVVQCAIDLGQREDMLTFSTREFVLSARCIFCMSARWRDSERTRRWAESVLLAQTWIAPVEVDGSLWVVLPG